VSFFGCGGATLEATPRLKKTTFCKQAIANSPTLGARPNDGWLFFVSFFGAFKIWGYSKTR